MHVDEIDIGDDLVRRLLAEQFPVWSRMELRRVEPAGTVNAIFRLGDNLSVRLPRRAGSTTPGGKEFTWLPRLARHVSLDIPAPVAQGSPGLGYPWYWDVLTWVDGEVLPVDAIDPVQAAQDLACFVGEMQRMDPTGAPRGRGISLAERDREIRQWLTMWTGDPAVVHEWERALAAPAWQGPPTWHHGDLDVRNWLVRNRRIAGVIDWGAMGIGDPACDVMVAWKLHSSEARDAFRERLQPDDSTWDRARGWALSQAVAALCYYTPENNHVLYQEAEHWLRLVLSERE